MKRKSIMIPEKIIKDERFQINDNRIDDILYKYQIYNYKIIDICVGKIQPLNYRLDECPQYAYLINKKLEYDKYCNNIIQEYGDDYINRRNRNVYEELIISLQSGYNPSKGIIIVDQNNILLDGQHRSSFLLLTFGPKYKVKVLKLYFSKGSYYDQYKLIRLKSEIKRILKKIGKL